MQVRGSQWVDLGNGELIVQLDGGEDSDRVTAELGAEWEWDSEEYGVLTDEDGTVTEWVTLHGARRKHLTELPSVKVLKMLKELTAA